MCDADGVAVIASYAILLFIVWPLTIYFCYNLWCNKKNDRGAKTTNIRINIASAVVLFSFVASVNLSLITGILYCEMPESDSWSHVTIPAFGFYVLGQWCILLVFALRIHYTFEGSLYIFAYSNKIVIGCYVSVFLTLILLLTGMIVRFNHSYAATLGIGIPIILLFFGNYIIFAILFWRKMIEMIKYKIVYINNESKKQVIDITSMERLVRYTLLVLIGLISTILSLGALVIDFVMRGEFGDVDPAAIAIGIDCTINAICVCLLFGFSQKLYDKLCGCGHRCLKNLLITNIFEKRKKENENKNDLELDGDDSQLKTKQELQDLIFS